MARIAGVDIPDNKRVEISLTYIFGVGHHTSQEVLKKANIDFNKRVKDLTEAELGRIREILEKNYRIEGDLRREIGLNIKRLQEIGCYRGWQRNELKRSVALVRYVRIFLPVKRTFTQHSIIPSLPLPTPKGMQCVGTAVALLVSKAPEKARLMPRRLPALPPPRRPKNMVCRKLMFTSKALALDENRRCALCKPAG